MEQLIYDRTQEDVEYASNHPESTEFLKGAYNYTDLNRVETKVKELNELLNKYNYIVSIPTIKLDWSKTDFFTKADSIRYLDNINKIRQAYLVKSTTPATPATLNNLNYVKANDIEKILADVEDLIHGMEQYFVYSGVANSGQSRMWQNRFRRTTYTEQSGTQFITSDNLVFYDSNNNKFIVKE